MKSKILLLVLILTLMFTPLACQNEEVPRLEPHEIIRNWTIENETQFLRLCEENNLTTYFEKNEYGNFSSYYHHRWIDEARVESDGVGFSFKDGELRGHYFHWREDLPDELPEIISEGQASKIASEIAGRGNTTAKLLYIEPSEMWNITPTDNPCWVIYIWDECYAPRDNMTFTCNVDVVVVDAVTEESLGCGTPLP